MLNDMSVQSISEAKSKLQLQTASSWAGADLPLEWLLYHRQALQSGRECLCRCPGTGGGQQQKNTF